MAKFSLHQEHLAREIFPATIKLDITSMGSNGFNVTGFSALYPKKLNVFVPYNYATNRISSNIPADFESFFKHLDMYIEYLNRLLEIRVSSPFYGRSIEYAIGQISSFEYGGKKLTTFALKPHGAKSGGLVLLCRELISNGGDLDVLSNSVARVTAECHPDYIDTADALISPKAKYVYWSIRPSQVFSDTEFTLAALMATTPRN
ncbi:hypothetical protein IJG78_03835 [Candidatus Saccharibacteria bacterium]|nr:hypothetical protein [Candidatus Saccharibacteria bacterium]